MVFSNVFLLLIAITSVKMIGNPDPHCDYLIRVPNRQMITVSNAEWPSPYLPNLICRWVFDCPSGYACRLRCRDVGLPKTHRCFLDRLMVSTTGNLDLSDSHVYCGGKKVNARSIGSRMVLGLVTSETSPGGRFRCKVRPEPWVLNSNEVKRAAKNKSRNN